MALTIVQTLLIKLAFILLGITVCGFGFYFAYKFRKVSKILIGFSNFFLSSSQTSQNGFFFISMSLCKNNCALP